MRISPINNFNKSFSVPNKVRNSCNLSIDEKLECNIPFYAYKSNFLPPVSFGKIQKIDKPKDFSDIEAFAQYFENKIQRQLLTKDEEDIEEIVSDIQKATEVDKKTVLTVLSRVTQFASYSQLNELFNQLKANNIKGVVLDNNLNLNSVMRYLIDKKELYVQGRNIKTFEDPKKGYFMDEFAIQKFENNSISKNIISKKEDKFIIVDGWNTNICGENMAYTMFGSEHSLTEIGIGIINKMKETHQSLEQILNGDMIKRVKNVFGENADVVVLKSEKNCEPSIETICNNLKPQLINKKEIKGVIDFAINNVKEKNDYFNEDEIIFSEEEVNKNRKLLAEYLNSFFSAYSSESLNEECKKKYKLIENQVKKMGKTMSDVVYLVPKTLKSFGLVTYQYAKANNIPYDKIVQFDKMNYLGKIDGKICVILDDFIGSGDSLLGQYFDYRKLIHSISNFDDFKLIFSPVICMKQGMDNLMKPISRLHRKDKDIFMPSKLLDFNRTMSDHLDSYDVEKNLKPLLGNGGYYDNYSSIMFPFSIPDNNTDFGTLFSAMFFENFIGSSLVSFSHMEWEYRTPLVQAYRNIKLQNSNN